MNNKSDCVIMHFDASAAQQYERPSIKSPHFVCEKDGRHGQFLFLIGWNFRNRPSETKYLDELLVGTNNVCEVLLRKSSLHMDLAKTGTVLVEYYGYLLSKSSKFKKYKL